VFRFCGILKTAGQLRQSRIALWTKEEVVRKGQYLAEFRSVLSAERYRKVTLRSRFVTLKNKNKFATCR
jgi:hypothetical protein